MLLQQALAFYWSFRFRSARFSRVALVCKPWPLFALFTTWRKSLGGTPGDSWWGWAALFFNSWPYFRKKKVIFQAFFQSWPLVRNYVKEFANISFSFLCFNLELKRQIRAYTAFFFPRKPHPITNQNEQSVYPFLDQNSAKTISFGLAHANLAYSVYKGNNPWKKIQVS